MTEALRFWEAERAKQHAEEPTPAPVPTAAPVTSPRVRPRLRASEVAEIRKLGAMADEQEADESAEVTP